MKKLDKLLKIRRKNANILYDGLKKFESSDSILDLPNETNDKIYNWYLFTVRFKDIKTRERVKKQLISNEIGAVVYYDPPVHKTPYYQDLYPLPENALPNTISNWQRVLSLPVHPLVTENDLYRLIKIFENSIISKM